MEYQVEAAEVEQQPTAVVRGLVSQDGIAELLGGVFAEGMGVVRA